MSVPTLSFATFVDTSDSEQRWQIYNAIINNGGGGGGGGGSVQITSPVDGSGNVLVNLQTSIPAGGNTIGNVGINGIVPVSGTFYQTTQPVSEADGVNIALGAKNDAAWTTGSGSLVALGKAMVNAINAPQANGNNTDANAPVSTGIVATEAYGMGYNGSTWDRLRAGVTGVVSSVLGFSNVYPFGTYNSTPPTLTNGQSSPLQLDASGNSKVSTAQLAASLGQTVKASSPSFTLASDQTLNIATANLISSPLTSSSVAATGTYGPVSVAPEGYYLISVGKTYTAATITFTASGGASGQNVITTATTPATIAIGQQIVGTGVPSGSVVTAFTANTSVTISLPLKATASGTMTCTSDAVSVTFQSSVDGSTFQSLPAVLLSTPSLQAPASTQYYSGIYLVQAPVGTSPTTRIKMVVNTLTNATLTWSIDNFQPGQTITLPLNQPNAFTQANWPTGASVLPLIDRTFLREITFDVAVFGGTSQTVTYYQSNDPNFAAPQGSYHNQQTTVGGGQGSNYTAAGIYKVKPAARYFCAVETGTALTGWTMFGGASVSVSPESELSVYVNGGNNAAFNFNQLAGSVPSTSSPQGSTNKSLSVLVSGVTNSTLTTTAFAGNGATNGATQAIVDGGMASAAFDISVTTLTLGSATSVLFSIEESFDNGTTFSTIWTTQPVTTTGHIRVPALNISGRIRLRAWSIGGTSTTVTVATNIMESGIAVLKQMQHCDVYASTNPMTTEINGITYASTLVSTTLSSVSSVALVEGCKNITISGVFTGGTPTVGPVYTLQISQDGTNWFSSATTMTPGTAVGTYMATLANACARYARVIVSTASTGGTAFTVTYIGINGTN